MQRASAIVIVIVVVVLAAVLAFLLLSSGARAPSPSPSGSASAAATASASVAADLVDRRWTVLFVGIDLDASRESRAEAPLGDALLLASLSADQSSLTLISLPRDVVDVPLADGGTWNDKINALYNQVGVDELVGAMETLYELPIDAHVVLDMDDFAGLVDATRGVDVSPDEPLEDPIVDLDLSAGPQVLDGPTALAYVRTRVDEDYGRMRRQQEVILALVERLVDPSGGVDVRAALDGLDSLETDLPLDQLPSLLELARRATLADVDRLVIEPPLITFEGDRDDGRGYILEADVDAIRAEIQELIAD